MIILLIEIRAELEKYLMHFEMNNDMFSNDHIQFRVC